MVLTVIIKQNPFTENTASSNRILSILENLQRTGTRVELIVYGFPRTKLSKFSGCTHGIAFRYKRINAISGLRLKLYHYFGDLYDFIFIRRWALKSIDIETKIIWLDGSIFTLLFLKWSKFKKVGKFFHADYSEYTDLYRLGRSNKLQKILDSFKHILTVRVALNYCDSLSIMTRTLINDFLKINERINYVHLPMTVDFSRFRQIEDACDHDMHKPYLAFVGVMNDSKEGVDYLIKAFAEVVKKFVDLKLLLVGGDNIDSRKHKDLIWSLGLENKVIQSGLVNREAIPSLMFNAKGLVLPRPASRQAQGGFPTKLGEYLASSRPVVATRVGEIPEYLQDSVSVFFAEPNSVSSLRDAILRLLDDTTFSEKVGSRGRDIAWRQFNGEKQAIKLMQHWDRLP